jgi:hypothetical protein
MELSCLFIYFVFHGATTRRAAGAKNIASQYARTDIWKESFAIRVVETWNRLPDRKKPESIKKKLKKLLWLRLKKNGWRNVRKPER